MSRPLALTDDLEAALVEAASRGVPLTTAAQAAGIAPSTVSAWIRHAPLGVWENGHPMPPDTQARILRFTERLAQAQAQFEAEQVAAIAAAGTTVGKSGVPEWRARAWLLNNHPQYRERYRQSKQVEHTGQVSHDHTHRLDQLPTTDLEALAGLDPLPALPEPPPDTRAHTQAREGQG